MASILTRAGRQEGAAFFSYWRTVTYLTSLTAFGGLFLTGELNPLVSGGFFGLWLFGFFYRKPIPFWRRWMSNTLTLLVIGLLAVNVKGQFFESLLTLLLYLVVAKSLTLKGPRDYLQTQILSFFVLLSTSVITVSFFILIFLLIYLLLATLGFILYSMTRPEDRVYLKRGRVIGEYAERLPRRLGTLAVRFAVLLGLLTAATFIVIPHLSVQRVDAPFSSRRASEDAMSGFSDEIEFGEFKSLQPDQRVVMRIEPYWADGQTQHRPDHLYLRGTPLEYYDEARWRRSPKRGAAKVEDTDTFPPKVYSRQRGRNMFLRVHQNPDFTKRIFIAPLTTGVDFGQDRQIRFDEANASLQFASFGDRPENTYSNPISYTLTCNVVDEATGLLPDLVSAQKRNKPLFDEWMRENPKPEDKDSPSLPEARLEDAAPSMDESDVAISDAGTSDTLHEVTESWDVRHQRSEMYRLLGSPGEVPWLQQSPHYHMDDMEREINLQLPKTRMMDRIADLAREEATGPSEAEMVLQLTNFFRREFQYTLEPETPSRMHPIEAFLFETQQGHCEYFATSLVLMLRSRGVPARVINGFYTTEWNALGDVYIAKQSDAHAWAEVWLEGPGWLTVDPTPSGSAGRGAYGFAEPTIPEIISEYIRIQWQRFVIDFSSNRQVKLFESLRRLPAIHFLFEYRDKLNRSMMEKQLNDQSESGQTQTEIHMWRNVLYLLDGLVAIGVLLGLRAGWRGWKNRSVRANGFTGMDYMDALLRRAKKLGRRRSPHETVAEFVDSLASLGWQGQDLDWIVGLYHRQRFSGPAPDPDERRRAAQLVSSLVAPGKI